VRVGSDAMADARAATFLADNGVGRFVLLNVAAHFAVRDWPPARCVAFLELQLERRPELRVVVTQAPGKEAQAAETVRLAKNSRVLLAPSLPLLAVAALVRRADAVISVDTALVHLASACGRPVVALYAPVVPADVSLWLPIGVPYRALASPLGGSVGDIPPASVAEATAQLLDETSGGR
jgi:ADP-heptose:LPS heptosyltransferase